ncbi:MAG: DUF4258 domain-containing protein [Nitrospira sp.]|nr:DUF4258 domain-containing protein [Nitrospira sp.]
MQIDDIHKLVRAGRYEVSFHAQQERLEDDLDISEVETAILSGKIIENYPDDPRGPSCLVSGQAGKKPVHVVVGWARTQDTNDRILRVITVYTPQAPKWSDPWTRGKKP